MNKIEQNYLFFAKKIIETTKRKNIENIILNKDKNEIGIIYKNKKIKVLIVDSLLWYSTNKLNPDTFRESMDFKNIIIIFIVFLFLIVWTIAIFSKSSLLFIITIAFMLILWLFKIPPPMIIVIFYVGIVSIFNFISKLFLKIIFSTLSFLSEKLFKKDYISIWSFKLWYIYNFNNFKQIIKKVYKSTVKVDYDDTYLYYNYILNTNKIKILYSDNNSEIELPKNIDKIVKYNIWKEVYKITTILDKFFIIYDNIKQIIEKEKKKRQEQIKQKQKEILAIYNPEIEDIQEQYNSYIKETEEIEKILVNLRKIYKQPKNIKIFEKIDNILTEINKNNFKIKELNEKLKLLYNKLERIDNLLKNIDKTDFMYISKKLLFFYTTYFKFLVWLYKFKSPYTKNKIIEIDNKINKEINSFYQANKKIKQSIKQNKKQYENKIKQLLKEIKKVAKNIIRWQSEIRLLEKKLKSSL